MRDISDIWQQAAQELGGTYSARGHTVNVEGEITVCSGNWTVKTHRFCMASGEGYIRLTTAHAFYTTTYNLKFQIKRSGILSSIGKLMGMQDIAVGDPAFDADFTIKGNSNHEEHIRELLADAEIKQQLEKLHSGVLAIRDDERLFTPRFKEDVDELYFQAPGHITDVNELVAISKLMLATLNRLVAIGAAKDEAVADPLSHGA